jgi:hypothetical protein
MPAHDSNFVAFLRDGIAGIVDGFRRARLYADAEPPDLRSRHLSPRKRTEVDLTVDHEAQWNSGSERLGAARQAYENLLTTRALPSSPAPDPDSGETEAREQLAAARRAVQALEERIFGGES